ncbi:unnamed protein product [Ectocarpus sp. 6 AP-2014]
MEKTSYYVGPHSTPNSRKSRGGTGCSCNSVLAIDPDKGGAVNDFRQASTAEE